MQRIHWSWQIAVKLSAWAAPRSPIFLFACRLIRHRRVVQTAMENKQIMSPSAPDVRLGCLRTALDDPFAGCGSAWPSNKLAFLFGSSKLAIPSSCNQRSFLVATSSTSSDFGKGAHLHSGARQLRARTWYAQRKRTSSEQEPVERRRCAIPPCRSPNSALKRARDLSAAHQPRLVMPDATATAFRAA